MKGLKILVVEDCYLMAAALEDVLTEAGADGVALAPSVAVALNALAQHTIDIACLDINFGSETSFPVADVLALRGIPFVFVTAYNADILPPAQHTAAALQGALECGPRW